MYVTFLPIALLKTSRYTFPVADSNLTPLITPDVLLIQRWVTIARSEANFHRNLALGLLGVGVGLFVWLIFKGQIDLTEAKDLTKGGMGTITSVVSSVPIVQYWKRRKRIATLESMERIAGQSDQAPERVRWIMERYTKLYDDTLEGGL